MEKLQKSCNVRSQLISACVSDIYRLVQLLTGLNWEDQSCFHQGKVALSKGGAFLIERSMTASAIAAEYQEYSHKDVSVTTVRCCLRECGLFGHVARRKPLLSAKN